MWFGVLGRLEARDDDGRPIQVGGSVRRELLAALLCRSGSPAAASSLIEDLWGAVPPRTAGKTLQSHLVRLRHDLGRGTEPVIVTEGTTYRLDMSAISIDAASFEAALDLGRSAFANGDDEAAIRSLDAALGWWRGEAYLDFADASFTLAERMRLADQRAVALETRTDAALRIGQTANLVGELEARIRREPYRERSWEQLILALYRSGRQADALATYRAVRDRLASDLGVDPGPSLRAMEQRVLQQDPALLVDQSPRAARPEIEIIFDRCPYRGLDGYGTDDATVFVGRERLTAALVGRLAEPGVVVVIGSSGSGKSSLVRAGVVPALRAGALPHSAAWRVEVAVPGHGVRPAAGVDVLVLDQAEEMFTVLDAVDSTELLRRLHEFVERGGRLVVVLRGEFFATLAEIPWLASHAERAPVLVGRMREDELARAIVEPARRGGVEISGDVVEAVLEAAAGQAQPLPLISLALVRAWEHRERATLSMAAYEAGGGVVAAIETTAEAVYARIADNLKPEARRLLVRMAVREGTTWVRRPLYRSADNATDDDSTTDAVIGILADGRLVTATAHRVELSHDALLEHWPRLRDWLDERVAAAVLLEHLNAESAAWLAGGRRDTDLYRGPRLQAALDWQAEHADDVSAVEAEFLVASAAAAESELDAANARVAQQARSRRRLRRVVAGLAVTLVLAIVASVLAVGARSRANHAATRAHAAALSADARRLAALSLTSPDLATSALLAAASDQLQDSTDSRGALLSVLEHGQSALFRVATPRRILRLVGTSDGSRLFALDNTGSIEVVDTSARKIVATFNTDTDNVEGVTDENAELILSGSSADGKTEQVQVLDAKTGRVVKTLDRAISYAFDVPAMATNGRWLVAVQSADPNQASRTLVVYDTTTWSSRTLQLPADIVEVAAGNNRVVAETADRTIYLIDPATMQPLAHAVRKDMPDTEEAANVNLTLSPDGRHLAYLAVADESTPLVLDTSNLDGVAQPLATQPQPVTTLQFSADSADLAVGSTGGSVNAYTTATGATLAPLAGESGAVLGAAWATSANGPQLFTAGLDSQVVSWDVTQRSRLLTQTGPTMTSADSASLVGDEIFGSTALDGQTPGTAEKLFVLDPRTGASRSWPAQMTASEDIASIVATRDDSKAMISVQDQTNNKTRWQLWDLRNERLVASLQPPAVADQKEYLTAAISPDGQTAVVALGDARLGVLSLPSGTLQRTFSVALTNPGPRGQLLVEPFEYSPTGQLVVLVQDQGASDGTFNSRIALVDVGAGKLIAQTAIGHDNADAAGWSSDNSMLAIGTLSGTLDLFNARTLQLIRTVKNAHAGYVVSVSFSPDDRTIVTSGTDSAMNFWDVATLVRQGPRITVPGGSSSWFAWYLSNGDVSGLAPDGTHPGENNEHPFDFPAQVSTWRQDACNIADSDITQAQWVQYAGDQPYHTVCSS